MTSLKIPLGVVLAVILGATVVSWLRSDARITYAQSLSLDEENAALVRIAERERAACTEQAGPEAIPVWVWRSVRTPQPTHFACSLRGNWTLTTPPPCNSAEFYRPYVNRRLWLRDVCGVPVPVERPAEEE